MLHLSSGWMHLVKLLYKTPKRQGLKYCCLYFCPGLYYTFVIMMLLVFLSVLVTTVIAVAIPEGCPTVAAVKIFDIPKYMGKWYEIQRYNMRQEDDSICNTATYTLSTTERSDINVENSMVKKDTNTEETKRGWASLAEPDARPLEGRLKVNFGDIGSEYVILKTDYTGYAIVWSCEEFLGRREHEEFAWILSRERTLTEDHIKQIDAYIHDTNTIIKRELLEDTEQDAKTCARKEETTEATSEGTPEGSSVATSAGSSEGTSAGSSVATSAGSSEGTTTPKPTTQAVETTTAGAGSTTASLSLVASAFLICKAIMP